ncbi:CHAP domain-containing protein [Novosphingobium huizhouense]|uniref:CHAP domain-containing protein n=1 Tax=Novosphingobium huizhouense TaxID=2866625 RepID=UPI001CD85D61|nr:CHAP domain-containing protein [Novosphingobium huizhouense]
MRNWTSAALPLAILLGVGHGASATARAIESAVYAGDDAGVGEDAGSGLADTGLECVPYARQVSGIAIYGDAWRWWDQAAGQYARGRRPKVGAVMSFAPYGPMRLGHVAAVSRIIDRRTVLLRHANWSPIGGRRGQIEDNVRAVDVSPDNDWSEVRVWYAPLGDLGTTHWPVNGFIYNEPADPAARMTGKGVVLASASLPAALARAPYRSQIGADFLSGIAVEPPARTRPAAVRRNLAYAGPVAQTKTTAPRGARSLADDPIGRIIAARMR